MGSRIIHAIDCRFERPAEVCRAHFLDMRHHIEHGVHRGIEYTILDEGAASCRVRQKFKVLGMTKVDELELSREGDKVVQKFLAGDFAGGTLTIAFTPDGTGTKLHADFDFPLRGVNRLLAPVIFRTVKKLAAQALEEDRVDLEQGAYQPSGWAAAQTAAR